VVGSSSGGEIDSIDMPEGYFKAFSNVQAKEGLRNLPNLEQDLIKRKESAIIYTDFLMKHNKNHVAKKWFSNHSFLKYPLLVNKRSEFMLLAEKHHITLGEWFISPLHPVEGDLSAWQFEREKYPVADYLSSHVVNLPTTQKNIDKVIRFLDKYSDYIL
jgi:dTDP-4-amino-4,6-dideoxygalactose transaminase